MEDKKLNKNEAAKAVADDELKNISGGSNPFSEIERVGNSCYDEDVKENI